MSRSKRTKTTALPLKEWRYTEGDALALAEAQSQAKDMPDHRHVFIPVAYGGTLPEGSLVTIAENIPPMRAVLEPGGSQLGCLWVAATEDLTAATAHLTEAGWEPVCAAPHTQGIVRGHITYWRRRVQ